MPTRTRRLTARQDIPKRLHGNIEIDLRRFGLPAQVLVHVAFDNADWPFAGPS